MNGDIPAGDSRESIEIKLTALLLGEVSEAEAVALKDLLDRDPELSKLHEQLQRTIGLVREATAPTAAPVHAAGAGPLPRLSAERREKLLASFKTITPAKFQAPKTDRRRWEFSGLLPLAGAAALIVLLAALMLPASSRSKARSQVVASRALDRQAAAEAELLASYPTAGKSVVPAPTTHDFTLLERRRDLSATPPAKPASTPPEPANINHYAYAQPVLGDRPMAGRLFQETDGRQLTAAGAEPLSESEAKEKSPGQVVRFGVQDSGSVLPAVKSETDTKNVQLRAYYKSAESSFSPADSSSFGGFGGGLGGGGTAQPADTLNRKLAAGEVRFKDTSGTVQFGLPVRGEGAIQPTPPVTAQPDSTRLWAMQGVNSGATAGTASTSWSDYDNDGALDTLAINGSVSTRAVSAGIANDEVPALGRPAEPPSGTPASTRPEAAQTNQNQAEVALRERVLADKPAQLVVNAPEPQLALPAENGDKALPKLALVEVARQGKEQAQEERLARRSSMVERYGLLPRELKQKTDAAGARSEEPSALGFIAQDQESAPAAKKRVDAPVPQPEVQTAENPFSTFSLNVSDVSFKVAAAGLESGHLPDPAGIRSEEFINAFNYRDPEPAPGSPIAFSFERARYPFAHNRDLLRLSVKTGARGREAGRPLNLVLLLDNSGSMERADRVSIVREALTVLAGKLQPQDKLSIVTFSRTAQLWADGIAGDEAAEAVRRVAEITPEGGTNLEEALRTAYEAAARHYLPHGINRVVLLTDGAANLGNIDAAQLKSMVEEKRKSGLALDCFGVGWDGYNDELLETLSRNGDGRYGFLNTVEQASSDFSTSLAGALQVAAADLKVQVQFNPARVTAYRQVGYAKHQLTQEQFRDNTVDAAELGAAETGNAIYLIETNPQGSGAIATVRVRYKVPGTSDYRELAWDVPYTGVAPAADQGTASARLAAAVTAFSEWLAGSPYASEVKPAQLQTLISGVPEAFPLDPRPRQLQAMILQAQSLAGK